MAGLTLGSTNPAVKAGPGSMSGSMSGLILGSMLGPPVSERKFKLKDGLRKTLRLLDNLADPNNNKTIEGKRHKGKNISSENILISDGIPTVNDLVLVQVENDPTITGYVQLQYLDEILPMKKYKLQTQVKKRTLRLLDNLADPNNYKTIEGKQHQGKNISSENILISDGIPTVNGLVLVQVENDPTITGYVQLQYLEEVDPMIGGGKEDLNYYLKYLKYKKKYLQYQKMIR